ncbi:MAG: M20/M25/M40 family metallo-hydrolase [Synergistaceae bacterium]|nr:M20/M25/M40 family metallo-hydrolase [Synergistaceae bacterium]
MKNILDFYIDNNLFSDLDIDAAVSRLSQALQCRTINYADHSKTDFNEFAKLHELIKSSFKNLLNNSSFKVIGNKAVLIKISGSDKSLKPCLLMAHQDVVPVVKGTENDWEHDAFSGFVDGEYIWGRGALDIKQMLFGILEACDYLIAHNFKFKRDVYLAFGDDEETLNLGAEAIAKFLKSQGVELEFVLDEGGGVIESGAEFGADDNIYISKINLAEKGYADLELSVESAGGHSSRPMGIINGTSLEILSRAIAAICDANLNYNLSNLNNLNDLFIKSFGLLSNYITQEPLKSLVKNNNIEELARYCLEQPGLFPYIATTSAATMIEGGSAACNVMPQNMRAVINFRLNQADNIDALLTRAESALQNLNLHNDIKLRYLQANNPSNTASYDSYGYKALVKSLNNFYKDVIFIPSLTVGATDAHCYEIICENCLRCSPFMSDYNDARIGVHGTNERILIKTYIQGIKVLIDFIINTCVNI